MEHGEFDLQRSMRSVYSLFSTFDRNNTEALEIAELMDLLKACKIDVTWRECEVIIKEMDANKDGVMDFGEFMTFLGMIFKIRFSKKTQLKDEFQMKLQQASKNNVLKKVSRNRVTKPEPPPRKRSVFPTIPHTSL